MSEKSCEICRRSINEWFLHVCIEDRGGYSQNAYICANCGVKLRLASEKSRDLQVDPWIHEAIARVLKGKE